MNFSIQQSELDKQKSPNDHEAIRNPASKKKKDTRQTLFGPSIMFSGDDFRTTRIYIKKDLKSTNKMITFEKGL